METIYSLPIGNIPHGELSLAQLFHISAASCLGRFSDPDLRGSTMPLRPTTLAVELPDSPTLPIYNKVEDAPRHLAEPACRVCSVDMLKVDLPPTPLIPIQLEPGSPTVSAKAEISQSQWLGQGSNRLAYLTKAYRQVRTKPGDWVAEASSGSTAIAPAMACASLNQHFLAVLPEGSTSPSTTQGSLMVWRGSTGT